MTIKYFLVLAFALTLQIGVTQSFPDKELQDFVEVYMSFKTEKKRDHSKDKKYFEKYNVTPGRYREINRSALTDNIQKLNANEKKLLAEIKKQNELLDKTNQELLVKICERNQISFSKYSTILEKYKTDIQFQRSLQPHFEAYINRMK